VPVVTAIASSCLVCRHTLADINPSFENDTKIVAMPPRQSTFSNCEEAVECDVEIDRQQAQSVCMHSGVGLAHVASHNAQFSAAFEEQKTIYRMFDHRQSDPVRCRAGFWYFEETRDAVPTIPLGICLENLEPNSRLNGQF
jgi:hypothetical protein